MIVMMVVKDDHEQSRLRQSYCGVWLISVTRMSDRPYQTLDNLCVENLLKYGREYMICGKWHVCRHCVFLVECRLLRVSLDRV